jgi:DNA-binding CsgD family transcriptional regulator
MPQVQPALSETMGFKVRRIEGLPDLESLRWGSETLLLSVRSLDRLQDIISTGNAGLMRGIHTLGVFMPTQVARVREFVTLLDGWLVWSGSADDLKAKLDLAASGYAIVAPAMISVMAADQHRLTLLDSLTEAHLSLLPLLADGMTDEEIANSRGATLPTTKLLVRQLLARLQCRNRTEAAIFAWRHANVLAQRRTALSTLEDAAGDRGNDA